MTFTGTLLKIMDAAIKSFWYFLKRAGVLFYSTEYWLSFCKQ
jgi:hypothetical protein